MTDYTQRLLKALMGQEQALTRLMERARYSPTNSITISADSLYLMAQDLRAAYEPSPVPPQRYTLPEARRAPNTCEKL